MNYMVHVSNIMWRIKNQPSNFISCSDNALRLLVLVMVTLYWGLQVTSSFSIWGFVLKGYFERGIFWRSKSCLKGIEDFNLEHWLQLLGSWMPHATANRSTEALLPFRLEFGTTRVPSPKTLVHWRMPTGGANWMRSLWAGWKRRRGERGWIHNWMVHADNQVLAGHGQAQIMWRFFGRLALNGQRRHHILYQSAESSCHEMNQPIDQQYPASPQEDERFTRGRTWFVSKQSAPHKFLAEKSRECREHFFWGSEILQSAWPLGLHCIRLGVWRGWGKVGVIFPSNHVR